MNIHATGQRKNAIFSFEIRALTQKKPDDFFNGNPIKEPPDEASGESHLRNRTNPTPGYGTPFGTHAGGRVTAIRRWLFHRRRCDREKRRCYAHKAPCLDEARRRCDVSMRRGPQPLLFRRPDGFARYAVARSRAAARAACSAGWRRYTRGRRVTSAFRRAATGPYRAEAGDSRPARLDGGGGVTYRGGVLAWAGLPAP
jgi:hypothetical protein